MSSEENRQDLGAMAGLCSFDSKTNGCGRVFPSRDVPRLRIVNRQTEGAAVAPLCADGALAHIRILNAIRIAPADLAAFIAARRVAPTQGK